MEHSVSVLKFAEARAAEIKTLMDDIQCKERKPSLQRLPYHMRRRAASHNPKRLPRNLREKAEENLAKPSKKKKRKNHKSLLEEYNSRQKPGALWLPTHIWFAKRFHMKNMFGYQLPLQATGKRFRSSYRATVKSALVQDLSYYCCIELRGTQENLLLNLSLLTDDSLGKNFAAESFLDGTKEGTCFLYHPGTFPFQAIGPVSFIWSPLWDYDQVDSCTKPESHRQLWIWCHPAIHEKLISVIVNVFRLESVSEEESCKKKYEFASKTNFMKTKLHFQKEPVYSSKDVTMVVLKDTLIRHRLIGPNATSILTSILKQNDFTSYLPQEATDCTLNVNEEVKKSKSLGSLFSNTICDVKQKAWQHLTEYKSSYCVPMNAVLGLDVDDPRIYAHPKDSGFSLNDDVSIQTFSAVEEFSHPSISFSQIWDLDLRHKITASQIPEHVLNNERSKYVIPEASELKKCSTTVPVLVIYQSAVNGYGSGWDIIAPQGWGMAFWMSFIYHGAQPAGLDDFCNINLESGSATFPVSFPDTKAGTIFEESTRECKMKQFYRYSRAKRPNFKVLGISNPFFMPWKTLVDDWTKEFKDDHEKKPSSTSTLEHLFVSPNVDESKKEDIFTLRSMKDIDHLRKLSLFLIKNKKFPSDETLTEFLNLLNLTSHSLISNNLFLKCLVLVKIKCLFRGTPFQFSGIYLPKESDLKCLKENPKYYGPVERQHCLEEEYLKMPANKRRKLLKEEAKVESKKLDRPEIDTIISKSDYKIIGYVSEGGYSRLCGQGFGLGHCTLAGLLKVFDTCAKTNIPAIVLVREQHVFQYRLATIEVIENPF